MPPHELWLRVPRNVTFERGFGVRHKPGDVKRDLTGTAAFDPLTGFACSPVTWSADDPYTWDVTGDADDYVEGTVPKTTAPWKVHAATGEFTATSAETLLAGHGFFFVFLIYEGAGPQLEVTFGGGWRLVLEEGVAELHRGDSDDVLAFAMFYDQDEWYNRAHTLYIYNVGTYVAVRRLGPDAVDGILYFDQAAADRTPKMALQAAKIRITTTGHCAFFASPERHATSFWFQHKTIRMPEACSTEPETEFRRILPYVPAADPPQAEPEVTVLDENGNGLGSDPVKAFRYQVEATLAEATGPNLYVTSVRAWFPPLTGSDGNTAVNLLAISGVAVRRVEERLSLNPQDNSLSFELIAERGAVSPYVQPNMLGAWKPGGTQRTAFLTDEPRCRLKLGYEVLNFECRDRWKSFETQKWSGQERYAGKLLATAYRDAALRAGLDASEAVVYAGSYTLPTEDDDGPEAFEFRGDQSVADILLYLKEQFGGGDVLRFRPDGKFYAEEPQTSHSGLTFYWSTPQNELAAIAKGTSTLPRILRESWDEAFNEIGFANEVWVIGYSKDQRPLVSYKTDWDSINNRSAGNFVGEWRKMVVVDAGLVTQEIVNWVCSQVWLRVRLLRLIAKCQAVYRSELLPGEIITVDGRGSWRILSMGTAWGRKGPLGLSDYELEAV